MTDETDGLAIARQRIAREAEERTGFLDLGHLGLSGLPEDLFGMKHLRGLNLGLRFLQADGRWFHSAGIAPNEIGFSLVRLREMLDLQLLSVHGCRLASLDGVDGLPALRFLDCSYTQVSDLVPLAALTALDTLVCTQTQVSELAPIAALTALKAFDCQATLVNDLAPLIRLTALETLKCAATQVSDLAPVASLKALQTLDCAGTPVSDLTSIAALTALQRLDCSGTQVRNLEPVATLFALRFLLFSHTQVSSLTPLRGLSGLLSLGCSSTEVSDLTPLATVSNLEVFSCSETRVNNLVPLSALTGLRSLNCNSTPVCDLGPIAKLTALEVLGCCNTGVSDLTPLATLSSLLELQCTDTGVSDLAPIAGLSALRTLHCSHTLVDDLTPIAALTALQSLHCSETKLSDLTPVANLTCMDFLYVSRTAVSDLAPLAGFTALRSLDCSQTRVNDLTPIANLTALESLNCSCTPVNNLAPLAGLTSLHTLNLSGCHLADLPRWLLELPSLSTLFLYDSHLPGVPAAVLSQSQGANCLEALRAHVRDLDAGEVRIRDVKLLVLGNGLVGKTQLCRRLRGEPYDDTEPSTHGILRTRAPLPFTDGAPATRLQIWDFGGQDLYHGTHALFMRSNAIFLLVWTPALEDSHEETHDGITFRNHPLAYWVDYVRHLGGKRSAVVVVQTRCDRAVDEAPCRVPEADLFAAFGFPPRIVRYSARTDRGRATLNEALAEAAEWLRDQEGIATIGAGRHRVKEKLEALRDADAAVAREVRQHRTITQEQFLRLCEEAGGVSAPEHLLTYLNNIGIVIYRPGLFRDAIILDQDWALEAIYAVFNREKCYRQIRRNKGRFFRSDLADWVWGDHGEGEQALFLSMMQSCGICFEHRPAAGGAETEYIAPDLLPERAEIEVELAQKWDDDRPTETATFTYALLHPGLIRSIISRIGNEAGIAADYWKGGVYVYETGTGSRGMIEAEMLDTWRGRIRLQTQRGRAAELLARLQKVVEEEQNKAGVTPVEVTGSVAGRLATIRRWLEEGWSQGHLDVADELIDSSFSVHGAGGQVVRCEPGGEAAVRVTFAQEPSPLPEWCVSYKWGDTTAEGREREAEVDRFCAEAKARGKTILRDKTAMGLGERISKFMQRIGRADRVFVFLSDKYLKSPFCMYELSEVWRNCRQDDEEFLKRIRVYALPCARIRRLSDQLDYAEYWEEEYQAIDTRVRRLGYDRLGEGQARKFRLMRKFSRDVGEILDTVVDILQPRCFDELVTDGVDD